MSKQILTPHKYLSPEEVKKFRKTLEMEHRYGIAQNLLTPVRDAVILQTILGAGLRVSESVDLRQKNLFLSSGKSELFIENSKWRVWWSKTFLTLIKIAFFPSYLLKF